MKWMVVAGSPGAGLGYVARVLRASGIPCSHEAVYDFTAAEPAERWPEPAEASWAAAPWLSQLDRDVLVVHLVREPVALVRTLLGLRLCDWGLGEPGAQRFIQLHLGSVLSQPTPLQRSIAFAHSWAALVDAHAACRIQVEALDGETIAELGQAIGIGVDADRADRALRHVVRSFEAPMLGSLEPEDVLGAKNGALVLSMAQRWGYL